MKRLAIVCLLAYLAAQAFQEYVFVVLTAAGHDASAWRMALDPLNRLRAFLLLTSFIPLTIAFIVICALKARTAPRRALVAGVFLLAFCFFEIGYRSVEYFVIDGIWTRALLETTDEAVRTTMQARLDVFGDIVRGIYFPLMLTRLVGSLFLFATTFQAASEVGANNSGGTLDVSLLGVWRRMLTADVFLRIATGIDVLRLAGRLAATYLGVTWLSPFNDQLYFPLVFLSLIALTTYLCLAPDRPQPVARPAS